jgi:hypothetical protein
LNQGELNVRSGLIIPLLGSIRSFSRFPSSGLGTENFPPRLCLGTLFIPTQFEYTTEAGSQAEAWEPGYRRKFNGNLALRGQPPGKPGEGRREGAG